VLWQAIALVVHGAMSAAMNADWANAIRDAGNKQCCSTLSAHCAKQLRPWQWLAFGCMTIAFAWLQQLWWKVGGCAGVWTDSAADELASAGQINTIAVLSRHSQGYMQNIVGLLDFCIKTCDNILKAAQTVNQASAQHDLVSLEQICVPPALDIFSLSMKAADVHLHKDALQRGPW
jgi:hypothetical protein